MRIVRTISLLGVIAAIGCSGVGAVDPADPPVDEGPGDDEPPPVDDGRYKVGLQALYKFDSEAASIADLSGVAAPLDLQIPDLLAVSWMEGGGLAIVAPTLLNPLVPSSRITSACQATNAVTLEAWVRPANLTQQNARILTYSGSVDGRNFSLEQDDGSIRARLRSTGTDANGNPATTSDVVALTGAEVHVVYTFDPISAVLYLDGQPESSQVIGGDFSGWDETYTLGVGNEIGAEDRPWLGQIHLLAVYCGKLDAAAVAQNYVARY